MTDPTEYERLVELAARALCMDPVGRREYDSDARVVLRAIGLTHESCIVPRVATSYMLNAVREIGGSQWVANAQATWPTMIAARPQLGERSDG